MKVTPNTCLESAFFAEEKVSQKADTLYRNGLKTLTKYFDWSSLVKSKAWSTL